MMSGVDSCMTSMALLLRRNSGMARTAKHYQSCLRMACSLRLTQRQVMLAHIREEKGCALRSVELTVPIATKSTSGESAICMVLVYTSPIWRRKATGMCDNLLGYRRQPAQPAQPAHSAFKLPQVPLDAE